MKPILNLNRLPREIAREKLLRCCGSSAWVDAMLERIPFASDSDLFSSASAIWHSLDEKDRLEAFSHHPRIGDVENLRKKFAASLAEKEQAGIAFASEEQIHNLAIANDEYVRKFGFIFLIFASGKTAGEMLDALQKRLKNDRSSEIKNASVEHAKITQLRLEKLLEELS